MLARSFNGIFLYLKYTYNESDEGMCQRWSQDVYFQFFSGLEYFESRPPCDPTQIGRFRQLLGEEGVEELLSQTIQTAFKEQLVDASDLDHGMNRNYLKGAKGLRGLFFSLLNESYRWQISGVFKKQTLAAQSITEAICRLN